MLSSWELASSYLNKIRGRLAGNLLRRAAYLAAPGLHSDGFDRVASASEWSPGGEGAGDHRETRWVPRVRPGESPTRVPVSPSNDL